MLVVIARGCYLLAQAQPRLANSEFTSSRMRTTVATAVCAAFTQVLLERRWNESLKLGLLALHYVFGFFSLSYTVKLVVAGCGSLMPRKHLGQMPSSTVIVAYAFVLAVAWIYPVVVSGSHATISGVLAGFLIDSAGVCIYACCLA